jgi:hypothetical protein
VTRTEGTSPPRRRLALPLVLGLLAVGAAVLALAFFRRPPQMGADEEVFRTVDALFTAVTARNEKLLAQCEGRLRAYREAGRVPGEACDYLDGVIARARGGEWRSAAERLYEFMSAQRREGDQTQQPNRKGTGGPPGKK